MKEIHAYKNEDGTYKLELIADYYDKGKLIEARIVYDRARVDSNYFVVDSRGEIFSIVVDDNNSRIESVEIDGIKFEKGESNTNNTVYVAYAHHFDGHMIVIGVYYNPDDARHVCEEWESKHAHCDWTEWEPFEIR